MIDYSLLTAAIFLSSLPLGFWIMLSVCCAGTAAVKVAAVFKAQPPMHRIRVEADGDAVEVSSTNEKVALKTFQEVQSRVAQRRSIRQATQ